MNIRYSNACWPALVVLVFLTGLLTHLQAPGIYMDAVNPDYIAARILHPTIQNRVWIEPSVFHIPILGNLYHGMQNLYVGLPIFFILGDSVFSLRLAHGLFGAATLWLGFLLVRKLTGSGRLAFLAMLCLAVDIGFVASFETQNFIILGGMPWLFGSLLLLFSPEGDAEFRGRKTLFAGVLMGLAVYAYFVFLFFLPALALVILSAPASRRDIVRSWSTGFVIGMLPYVLGYLSAFVALGGIGPFLQWLRATTTELAPTSGMHGPVADAAHAGLMAWMALLDRSNEVMVFGRGIPSLWTVAALLLSLAVILAGLLAYTTSRDRGNHALRNMLLFAASYLCCSAVLGGRLWPHHYSVLVPLLYVTLPLAVWQVGQRLQLSARFGTESIRQGGAAALFLLVLSLGLYHQWLFYGELAESGGRGKMSNALDAFAQEARTGGKDTLYLFPEWGFFMPFAFLTENQVPYQFAIDADARRFAELPGKAVKLAFWDPQDTQRYSAVLAQQGLVVTAVQEVKQGDGADAFVVLSAQAKPR